MYQHHKPNMPSPPYTPYEQQTPHLLPTTNGQQHYIDPYVMAPSYQQYNNGYVDPMAPIPSGQATIHYTPSELQQQQQQQPNVMYSQSMPQPTGTPTMLPIPTQLQSGNVNPTFAMQATVFTTSPSSSTVCYQPPNLTDLQFPSTTEPQTGFSGFNAAMPANEYSATMAMTGNVVNRSYVSNARERYTRVACPSQGVHVGSKRTRDTQSSQSHGMPEWSSQWLQGTVPPAHVY